MPFQWGPPAVCPFPGEEMSPNKNKNKNKKTKTKQTNKKRQKTKTKIKIKNIKIKQTVSLFPKASETLVGETDTEEGF